MARLVDATQACVSAIHGQPCKSVSWPTMLPLPRFQCRPEVANNPWQWFVPADEDLPKYQDNRGHVRNVTVRKDKGIGPD